MNEGPKRLREGGDALARLVEAAARAQESGSPRARERVFLALSRPRTPRWPLPVAVAAAAAAALAVLVLVRRPPPLAVRESKGAVEGSLSSRLSTGPDGAVLLEREGLRVALGPSSELRLSGGVLRLERGSAALLVSGPFAMQAGAVRVETASALFAAQVAERTSLFVRRGRIDASGTLVLEGGRWPADAPPPDATGSALADLVAEPSRGLRSLAQLETPPPPPRAEEDLLVRARDQERAGRFAQAASLYAQLAQGEGPRAGNALYELARLRLRRLDQPEQALQALVEYRRRFPEGPLAQEAALSAIEARLALDQEEPALREMDAFLTRFGGSERAGEVRFLRASLRLRRGSCAAAEPDVRALLADPPRGDDALFGLAACAQDEERDPARLREYLTRFPQGRHRREALDRLSEQR